MTKIQNKAILLAPQVAELIAQGVPHSKIRQRLDISFTLFDRVLVAIGKGEHTASLHVESFPKISKVVTSPTDSKRDQAVIDYYGRHTGHQTQQHFGISRRVLLKILDANGIRVRVQGERADRPCWHKVVLETVASTQSLREAANLLGVSHQRVSQILKLEGQDFRALRTKQTG